MNEVTVVSIDLAKSIFQVCALGAGNEVVFNRKVRRAQLADAIRRHPGVPVVMESCAGSNFWGRTFEAAGHAVRLIPPQHVRAFVRGNKNDANDALAIAEASQRPNVRSVPIRSLDQTDVLIVHRAIERQVRARTALCNQIRGICSEYGLVFARNPGSLRREIEGALEDAENELTPVARELIAELLDEWSLQDVAIRRLKQRLEQGRQHDAVERALSIPGVGIQTATATWAKLSDGSAYRNGRAFAANLGLVPSQHSSGGRDKLGRISKRGDRYLRWLLVQGANSLLKVAHRHPGDRLCRWALSVKERRGHAKAAVAVANKLARVLWAVIARGRSYQGDFQPHAAAAA